MLDDDILGSMEFGCKASGAKLVAVIGHSNCGAIKGAVDDVKLGKLSDLLSKIKPAEAKVPADVSPRTSKNVEFVGKVEPRAILLGHGEADSRQWFEEQIHVRHPNMKVFQPQPGKTLEV